MLLSQIFAWISVFLCVMEIFRYVARISKVKALNQFFHKIHIPFGTLLLVAGVLHGLLAGNPANTALADIELAAVIFTVNWGTLCFICAVLLAVSYLLRKKLRRKWMLVHRVLTVLMIVLLTVHLADVGIHLPDRWVSEDPVPHIEENIDTEPDEAPSEVPAVATPAPAATATPQPQTSSAAAPTEGPVSSAPSPQPVSEEPEVSEAGMPDGVYTGRGQGRNGEITVNVTIRSGEIVDIQVVSHVETPKYFARAEGILDAILSAGSTEVDAVTGATLSSDGIKAAVADALGQWP